MEYEPIKNVIMEDGLAAPPKVVSLEALGLEAHLAFQLIERWGMVFAAPDGEDSAGRAKIRPEEPEVIVSRAFTISTLFVQEARNRGLMVAVPAPKTWEEREAERKAARAAAATPQKDL